MKCDMKGIRNMVEMNVEACAWYRVQMIFFCLFHRSAKIKVESLVDGQDEEEEFKQT